jgi:hypothetical protein
LVGHSLTGRRNDCLPSDELRGKVSDVTHPDVHHTSAPRSCRPSCHYPLSCATPPVSPQGISFVCSNNKRLCRLTQLHKKGWYEPLRDYPKNPGQLSKINVSAREVYTKAGLQISDILIRYGQLGSAYVVEAQLSANICLALQGRGSNTGVWGEQTPMSFGVPRFFNE